jgi:AraC family transcriptional activator of tynA and feaB
MIALTDSVPARDKAEFWADLVSRHVTPIRIEPRGERSLRGEIDARPLGDLGIAQVAGQGLRAAHTNAHIARAAGHVHSACVNLQGRARITRGRETVELAPGDVFITDSRHEFALDLDRPWRHLVVTLPTSWLDARVAHPEVLAGAVVRNRPLARLWAKHLEAGFAVADGLSPPAAASFIRHSVELLAQLCDETFRDDGEAKGAATFLAACRVIAAKFADPRLTPAVIARHVGVSNRTLARVFAAHNESVMRRVLDERIRHAARLLAAPRFAHRSVTDVAFACGFNDLSHFGRVFTRALQVTPSAWRRRHS